MEVLRELHEVKQAGCERCTRLLDLEDRRHPVGPAGVDMFSTLDEAGGY